MMNIMDSIDNAKPYNEIVSHLYLGGVKALKDTNVIQFHMIVNLIKSRLVNDKPNKNCEVFIHLPVDDSPDECHTLLDLIYKTEVLEKMHTILTTTNKYVLVHCFAGMQRSCALVACYLIKYYTMTPEEAIEYIKSERPIAFFGQVNFMKMITMFYQNLLQENNLQNVLQNELQNKYSN
jgi:protein-tyrosine phosphatase